MCNDDSRKQLDDLTDKLEKAERCNKELQDDNHSLRQDRRVAYAAYAGLCMTTIFCGVSLARLNLDKPKAAVLIVTMLCWACLTAMAMRHYIRDEDRH